MVFLELSGSVAVISAAPELCPTNKVIRATPLLSVTADAVPLLKDATVLLLNSKLMSLPLTAPPVLEV
jgi:hypothetical protein